MQKYSKIRNENYQVDYKSQISTEFYKFYNYLLAIKFFVIKFREKNKLPMFISIACVIIINHEKIQKSESRALVWSFQLPVGFLVAKFKIEVFIKKSWIISSLITSLVLFTLLQHRI